MKLFFPKKKENIIKDVLLKIYKFNTKVKPNKDDIIIICCFSEFGCEVVGCMYSIPQIIKKYPDKYKIVVGWYGRSFLYSHLVDEFWELDEQFMFLKDFSRAFHHISRNLKNIENKLRQYGNVIFSSHLGRLCVSSYCKDCGFNWSINSLQKIKYKKDICPECSSKNVYLPVFYDIDDWKSKSTRISQPSFYKLEKARSLIKKPCVGIFARNRNCYGRNFNINFYIKVIELIKNMGYNIIWLGEKCSVFPCPVDDILDFSRSEYSDDLEFILSLVKNCEFTVQFWTASTRLSSIVGVPYILFETPEQIYGEFGHEGIRRRLCDFSPSKLVLSHFESACSNQDRTISLLKKSIEELTNNNYCDIIGDVIK